MRLAVLTGDIVGSSDMSSAMLDDTFELLGELAREISGWHHSERDRTEAAVTTGDRFARRGGDGWQMAFDKPALALRATLYTQARLMMRAPPVRSRIAAAAGEGHLPEDPDDDLNSAHGEAFNASGRLLENLTGRVLLAHAGGGPLNAVFRLADHISQGWTATQAQAVSLMLPPGSGPRRVAAERLGVSRQAVDQSLWGAGYPAIADALELVEGE